MGNILEDIQIDPKVCRKELDDFSALINDKSKLKEREDILDFFKERRNLSAFIGKFITDISEPNKIAYEFELFGKFRPDLVIGNSDKNAYVFIEFEAGDKPLFVKKKRVTTVWSPAFEAGFSQLVDWFWLWHEQEFNPLTSSMFNCSMDDPPNILPMLIVGREMDYSREDKRRLRWRIEHIPLGGSKRLLCFTYDNLYKEIYERLKHPLENLH